MLIHYLKFTLKILIKDKLFTLINLIGFSLALASSFLIIIFVMNEISFDNIHPKKDKVYRLINYQADFGHYSPQMPFPLAELLKTKFPEIHKVSQMRRQNIRVLQNEDYISENSFWFSDSNILQILNIPLLGGNLDKNLLKPYSVIISEKMAEKYFKTENPIGKLLTINLNRKEIHLVIVRVFKNIPWNSSFQADFISDINPLVDAFKNNYPDASFQSNWSYDRFTTLVLLKKNTNFRLLQKKIDQTVQRQIPDHLNVKYMLQPFDKMYLHSGYISNNQFRVGNIKNIYILLGIAFLIIACASINYVILSSAKSLTRLKEIGIRKVMGISKISHITQTLTESVLMAFISIPFAFFLVKLLLPTVSSFFDKTMHFSMIQSWDIVLLFVLLTALIGILSGSFISYFIVSKKPLQFLRNQIYSKQGKALSSKIFVVLQMIIFTTLLSSSFIVYSQLHYGLNKDLGIDKSGLLIASFDPRKFNYTVFKNEIRKIPNVLNVSGALFLPPTNSSTSTKTYRFDDPTKEVVLEELFVDFDFTETYGLELISGRSFSKEYVTDNTKASILSESAVIALGMKNPIGKVLDGKTVIGVIKDFYIHSLYNSIQPLRLTINSKNIYVTVVRINMESVDGTINDLSEVWQKVNPDSQFNYKFYNDALKDMYLPEIRLSNILFLFAILAIIIGSLGLFGLSLFLIKQNMREVVIRKIHGASTKQMFVKLSKYFLYLFFIAYFLAIPITWYFIQQWIDNFYYKIGLNDILSAFIASGITTFIIVMMVVSLQIYRVSKSRPSKLLMYD